MIRTDFMRGVIDSVRRELNSMVSDPGVLLTLLAGPVLYSLLFGLTYVKQKVYEVPVIVVDHDRSALSRTIIRDLDANEAVKVSGVAGDESVLPRQFMDEDSWAAVIIPPGCESSLKRGEQVHVTMMVNTSNIVVGNYVQRGVQAVLASVGAGVTMDKMVRRGTSPDAVLSFASPVQLQSRVLFNPGSNYANFVVPLLLVILIHQIVAMGAGMSWSGEFESARGTAPAPGSMNLTALAGKSIPYFLISLFWLGVSAFGTQTWLAIPFEGNVLLFVLFAVIATACVVLLGTLLGLLIRSRVGVVQMLFFYSMPAVLISGGSWPLGSMPVPVRWLALVLPSTHMMTAYRRLALEGAGFAAILPQLAAMIVLSAAMLAGVMALFNKVREH